MEIEKLPISERLKMNASLVPAGVRLADVGCDHAYVSIWLTATKTVQGSIAMDVVPGPLARAKENVSLYGLENQIELRLSDGLEKLAPGEAGCILISGMGGPLMQQILSNRREIADTAECLVLQPQSELEEFRDFLHKMGYWITAEKMCLEEGKYYFAMRAEKRPAGIDGEIPEYYLEKAELKSLPAKLVNKYGPCLIREHDGIWPDYIRREKEKREQIVKNLVQEATERSTARVEELQEEIRQIQKLIDLCEVDTK